MQSEDLPNNRPNVILILNDDMGFSDLGCYGGEMDTPNLNSLAEHGLRFINFYNTARCCPSRASLLTGLHPHQAGVGYMVGDWGPEEYSGSINHHCVTIAEVLKLNGYKTYLSGKWHITNDKWHVNDAWPKQRGFDKCYCFLGGASSYFWPKTMVRGNESLEEEIAQDEDYYITDAISDNAANYIKTHANNNENPFFLYVAYTAPHWPLHAKEKDIKKYKGRFDKGWDTLRRERLKRMIELGILEKNWEITPRDPREPSWDEASDNEWEALRMEVYAAQIDAMDQGIGRIIQALKETNQFNNTLIMFLADNGGCSEEVRLVWKEGKIRGGSARRNTRNGESVKFGNKPSITPGPENSYVSYGTAWANLSNTPFRMYKKWTHEGGIATPFIVHYPDYIQKKGEFRRQNAQLTDVMATIVDITGAKYPETYQGHETRPMEGTSLREVFEDKSNNKGMLFFEHMGNATVRDGKWKLVRDFPFEWELYDMDEDRTELHNLIDIYRERGKKMIEAYREWADRIGVIERDKLMLIRARKKPTRFRRWLVRFGSRFSNGIAQWQKIIKKRKRNDNR
ncbi:MAG: sulfatase-like hydrolase/transferase [Candidatus Lokiarchaeota archaeon]|nr:sulfatase-like hydrolase/transferase [Candidatus Lokiarchaeota archaeon]